jgi:wobble nucleotide-excising tRNase
VIKHYWAFFNNEYRELRQTIANLTTTISRDHSGDAAASFERSVRVLGERQQFWSRFCELQILHVESAATVRDWHAARDALLQLLALKQSAPMNAIAIPDQARSAVQDYEAHRVALTAVNQQIQQANQSIAGVKQRAAAANPVAISATLSRLRAARARHQAPTAVLCEAYLAEQRNKAVTERARDQARTALEQYRTNVFPIYQQAINRYLTRFNAGFHLDSVTAANTRGGPACTYNVVINDIAVAVAGGDPRPGDHSFRNIMSAGDRNALALAFFFASLEQDPNLASKIVIIDDPVSSLDDHRSLTTVQEIRRLATRVAQVIILSHSKPFLCRIWEGAGRGIRAALHVLRDGNGSTIDVWNVSRDSITEHDRRHAALREYLANGGQNEREIAQSIRPLMEAFFRVAYPDSFPPETLLGPFCGLCEQRVNTAQQILCAPDIQELRDILEYANRFHHDTNLAWQTEVVNSAELTDFVRRALILTRRA